MNNRFTSSGLVLSLLLGAVIMLLPGWHGWQTAQANATSIATVPIFASTGPALDVKPNLMFVLDDSGSMNWGYMPDDAGNFQGSFGYVSSQCNGMYYNPMTLYQVPVNANGTSYSPSSFTSAPVDGFGLTAGTTDLSTVFQAYNNDTAQPAYYYVYTGTQNTPKLQNYYDTKSVFYQECNSAFNSTKVISGTTPVNQLFTKVVVSATSGPVNGPMGVDERVNFANWYTYYSTRIKMMKSAAGIAFLPIDNKFRVGFMTINNNASPAFLNIKDFGIDPTTKVDQKQQFYSKLYASVPGNSTPLREALANVGQLYAGKIKTLNNTAVVDPVQYACQQNYVLLSTDGFWNGTDADVHKLDGTTMDNQDGVLPRPYNDGGAASTTTVTPYVSTQDWTTVTNISTQTNTWSKTTTTTGAACTANVPPANTVSAPANIGNSNVAAVGLASSNPDGAGSKKCVQLGTPSGTSNAWYCMDSNAPKVSSSFVTDTGANKLTWYLVSNINVTGQTGCISAQKAFGDKNLSATRGVCPMQTASGKLLTVTPYTQTEVISGMSSTSVDHYIATQTTTQSFNNGVPGPIGPLSPTSPNFVLNSNISVTNSAPSSITCAGSPGGCPNNAAGAWTAGASNPNAVCTATASLPAVGTTIAAITNTVNSGRTITTTKGPVSGPTAGTPTTTTVAVNGVANTLADTAAYYYNTNLRTQALGNCTGPIIAPATTPSDLCAANLVPPNGIDTATWQHMTTYTLGLGTRGRMVFSNTYLTDKTGDYFYVANGTTAAPSTCSWRDALTITGGPCNWPMPGSNQIENVDDLWHAAVNGHGNYFAATSPGDLASGLTSSLNEIVNKPRPGAASSAATTNPLITSTNNFQFSSYFETVSWSGELIRQTINLSTYTVPVFDPQNPNPATYDWSASVLLDAKPYANRTIYTKGASGLIPFTWTDLGLAGLQSNFTTPNISTAPPAFPSQLTGLTQFCGSGNCLSAVARSNSTIATGGAAGEALVNFLRGDRSNEEGKVTDNTKFYRFRKHVLGDIVSAQPQYVGPPEHTYADSGYAAFVTLQQSRTAVVYTAANDGMLHAFDAKTGDELWAYIPSFVLPRLYTLADKAYANKHQYFVEGTPIVGDICPKAPAATCAAGEWKTILVGGFDSGGTGYYALDITNPSSPTLLWEYTDANMGLTFGRPQITKLDDGTWTVLLTSGYNNCPYAATTAQQDCAKNGTGTGQGYLYVLNASTGTNIVAPISTASGTATAPSGLAQIIAQAGLDNVTTRVYGGDLNGNLWRFNIATGTFTAHLIASFTDATGKPQPITERPQVTTVNGLPVVYVGTGRYLGVGDVALASQQSFYAVKDDIFASTTYGNIRLDSSFINFTAVNGTCPIGTNVLVCQPGQVVRTLSGTTGASLRDASKSGWYLDFPAGAGEISFTDPRLVNGTITFATSVPNASVTNVCEARINQSEGTSFAYQLDFLTGATVGLANGVIGVSLGSGIATSPQIEQFSDGTTIAKFRLSTGVENGQNLRFNPVTSGFKRLSWRELISP